MSATGPDDSDRLSVELSPPFGPAAVWAAEQPQCSWKGKAKNWARRTFGCAVAATYALNNARLGLCPRGRCHNTTAEELRIVEAAQAKCEAFSCSPTDLLHLDTSRPEKSNGYLGCQGVAITNRKDDWGVCSAFLKAVRYFVARHRGALLAAGTFEESLATPTSEPPPLITTVPIGDERMPSLCFGLGHLAGQPQAARQLSLQAIRAGYRCFDTSMLYDGTEEALGHAWRVSGVPRHELFIKTKLLTWDDDKLHPNALGHVEAALEASLRRLQTSYLDVYMLHVAYRSPQLLNDTWPRLARARAAGKIRHLGVANADVATLHAFLEAAARVGPSGSLDYWQGKVSVYSGAVGALGNGFPAHRHVEDDSLVALARAHRITSMLLHS